LLLCNAAHRKGHSSLAKNTWLKSLTAKGAKIYTKFKIIKRLTNLQINAMPKIRG
jgi:hypothetical protein